MKKIPTLIENLAHMDKDSWKYELTISSKAESVQSIFYSLVSQDKTRFPLVSQDP